MRGKLFLLLLTLGAFCTVQAQQPPPTGFVQPIAIVAEYPSGGWGFLNVDSGGNLLAGGGVASPAGQPPPSGYVQPYALVAKTPSGGWGFLNLDSSGNLKTTGASTPFSGLTGGTNTSAAMVVGTGASLGPTGTGTTTANNVTPSLSASGAVTLNQNFTAPALISNGPGPWTSLTERANNITPAAGVDICDQDSTAHGVLCSFNGDTASLLLRKSSLGFGSTVSVFGTAPSVSSNAGSGSLTHGTDNAGVIATGTASTATTLTFGVGWGTWAACTVSASTSTGLAYVSAISKSAVTFTYITTGTPSLYYTCGGQ